MDILGDDEKQIAEKYAACGDAGSAPVETAPLDKVLVDGLLDTARDMSQGMELNHRVVRYINRSVCFTIKG